MLWLQLIKTFFDPKQQKYYITIFISVITSDLRTSEIDRECRQVIRCVDEPFIRYVEMGPIYGESLQTNVTIIGNDHLGKCFSGLGNSNEVAILVHSKRPGRIVRCAKDVGHSVLCRDRRQGGEGEHGHQ